MVITTTTYLFCIALGLIAGIFSVSFGVGSGVIIIPALTMIAAFTQKDAQGMSLVVMAPMAIMGAIRYQMNPEVQIHWKLAIVIAICMIIGVNFGAFIVEKTSNRALQMGFSIFLLLSAVRMFISAWQMGDS